MMYNAGCKLLQGNHCYNKLSLFRPCYRRLSIVSASTPQFVKRTPSKKRSFFHFQPAFADPQSLSIYFTSSPPITACAHQTPFLFASVCRALRGRAGQTTEDAGRPEVSCEPLVATCGW